jgi:hypothetical protein
MLLVKVDNYFWKFSEVFGSNSRRYFEKDLNETNLYLRGKCFPEILKKYDVISLIDAFQLDESVTNKCLNETLNQCINNKTYVYFVKNLKEFNMQVNTNILNEVYQWNFNRPSGNQRVHLDDTHICRRKLLKFLIVNSPLTDHHSYLLTACKNQNHILVQYIIKYSNVDPNSIPESYISKVFKMPYDYTVNTVLKSENKLIEKNAASYLWQIVKTSNIKCLKILLADSRFNKEDIIDDVLIKTLELINTSSTIKPCYNLACEILLSHTNCERYSNVVNDSIILSTNHLFNEGLFYLCYTKMSFLGHLLAPISKDTYIHSINRTKNNPCSRDILNKIIIASLRKCLVINNLLNASEEINDIIWTQYGKYLFNSDMLNHWPKDISCCILKIMITYI